MSRITLVISASLALAFPAQAQNPAGGSTISGKVTESSSGKPMISTSVTIEGTRLGARTDSSGGYEIRGVPGGPQVLRAQRIGYSPTRKNIDVPGTGAVTQNLEMARSALQLKGVQVTADPRSRARGELGTASVIEHEAIREQTASSLSGILELLPGVPLQAPGLDNVQQISLRAVPVSGGDPRNAGSSAQNLASFGTQVILDGVPLSNNANLQATGRGAAASFASSAGGGIDLRRIPASTIERVEVIRGIPSARFSDLTQGAILVDTRAGVISPDASFRFDASTAEFSLASGQQLGRKQTGTITADVARTRVGGGARNDQSTRISGQLAHRVIFGSRDATAATIEEAASGARLVLDTRADLYRLNDDQPESPTLPGFASRSHDEGARLSERLRLQMSDRSRFELTSSYEFQKQQSFVRLNYLRGATPVTPRLTAGQQVGRFVGGVYNSRTDVHGAPRFFFTRAEASFDRDVLGMSHEIRAGAELRREENKGDGLQFDVEFPPQSEFNGVRGFDRPRAFSSLPPIATTGLYLDDKTTHSFSGGRVLNVQGGLRLDALAENGNWFASPRDVVLQPRFNAEVVPVPWLALRAGAGRLAKAPSLADLAPANQYFDVINVNFFANNPAERLAVLTTYLFDPTNNELGYSIADKAEAGFELRLGSGGANLGFTLFADNARGGLGVDQTPTSILREHFGLTNTAPGSGRPPVIVQPPISVDSVPVLIDYPTNNTASKSRGFELTATLPEIPRMRTRFAILGSYVSSRLQPSGIEFATNFDDFQIDERIPRTPYYNAIERTGDLLLFTTRVIHQQPALGLVITGTIQHTLRETRKNIGDTDTLSFIGYVTRGGSLVPVPVADRSSSQYADLHVGRRSVLVGEQVGAVDWLFSFQVSKTLPLDGRFSFYAFNSFDRRGRYGSATITPRPFQSTRFGLELSMPLKGLIP